MQRLLMSQQQLAVGACTQLTGAHNQTREALAVRSLIAECIQLVKLLRALYQWRVSPAVRNLDQLSQRDTEAQIMTAIRQVYNSYMSIRASDSMLYRVHLTVWLWQHHYNQFFCNNGKPGNLIEFDSCLEKVPTHSQGNPVTEKLPIIVFNWLRIFASVPAVSSILLLIVSLYTFLTDSLTSSRHCTSTPAAMSRLQVGTQSSLRSSQGFDKAASFHHFSLS